MGGSDRDGILPGFTGVSGILRFVDDMPERREPTADDWCRCGHEARDHRIGGTTNNDRGCGSQGCDCGGFKFRYGQGQGRIDRAMKQIAALGRIADAGGAELTMAAIEKVLMQALDESDQPIVRIDRGDPMGREAAKAVEKATKGRIVKPVLEGRAKIILDGEV
jgi:hypothetical protein